MSVYLTFEEMREALGISEDELKRLVSEGEVRAFRRGSRMVFRASDVDDLRHRFRPDAPVAPLAEIHSVDDDVLQIVDAAPPSPAKPDAHVPVTRRAVPTHRDSDDIPMARLAEPATPPDGASPMSFRDVAYVLIAGLLVAALLAFLF